MKKSNTKAAAIFALPLLFLANPALADNVQITPGDILYVGETDAKASYTGQNPDAPTSECCDQGEPSSWNPTGNPTYSWSGSQSGSGKDLTLTTTAAGSKTLGLEVKQTFTCGGGSTEDTTKNGSGTYSVVSIDSLKFTDDATPPRTGTGYIKLVVKDVPRKVSVSIQGKPQFKNGGYPKWTLIGDNNADGNFEPILNVTNNDLNPTLEPAQGATKISGFIYETQQNKLTYSISAGSGIIKSIQDNANLLLGYAGFQGTPVTFSGNVAIETKNVDFYSDGTRTGQYWSGSGKVSASLREFKSPSLVIPIYLGVEFTGNATVKALDISLSVSGNYDDSKSPPDTTNITLSGTSTGSLNGAISLGYEKICALSLNASYGYSLSATATASFPHDGGDKCRITGSESFNATECIVSVVLKGVGGICLTPIEKKYPLGSLHGTVNFGPFDI